MRMVCAADHFAADLFVHPLFSFNDLRASYLVACLFSCSLHYTRLFNYECVPVFV